MIAVVADVKYKMSLAIIRDLAEAGYKVVAVHHENDRLLPLGHYSRYTRYKETIPCCKSHFDYANKLAEICEKRREGASLPVLLPVSAFANKAISANKDLIKKVADILIPDEDVLDKTNDKSYVLKVAGELGIKNPVEYTINECESLMEFSQRITYPCVFKFVFGESLGLKAEKRYKIVANQEQFIDEYKAFKATNASFLIQKYIKGNGFGVCFVIGKSHQPLSFICHRRIREYPLSGGPSTCCVSDYNPLLVGQAYKLLEKLKFTGVAMVEFKGDVLMEVNPRVWGTYPLTRYAFSNFTQIWARACSESSASACSLDIPAYKIGMRMKYFPSDILHGIASIRHSSFRSALDVLLDAFNPLVREGVIELTDPVASIAYVYSLLLR